jgi:hypothetical protein
VDKALVQHAEPLRKAEQPREEEIHDQDKQQVNDKCHKPPADPGIFIRQDTLLFPYQRMPRSNGQACTAPLAE